MVEYIEREAFLEEKRKLYCENCNRRYGLKRGKSVVCYEIGDAPCRSCGIGDVLDDVEDFPAADVVPMDFHERCLQIEIQKRMELEKANAREVVYCKDCKYWELSKFYPSFHVCTYLNGAEVVRNQDDFCSRGKKREES